MFPGALGQSLAGRALDAGIWSLDVTNIRDFAHDRHRSVDDTPFGGGAGMVLRPDIVDAAAESVADGRHMVCLSPRGRRFTQADARRFAIAPGLILLCGRYEGVDQRVIEARGMDEISIGDYVLSGGELAAQVLLDSIVRLLPGVMGAAESALDESFFPPACWSIPTILAPPNGRGTACRTCCCRVTTAPSPPGGTWNQNELPANADQIFATRTCGNGTYGTEIFRAGISASQTLASRTFASQAFASRTYEHQPRLSS